MPLGGGTLRGPELNGRLVEVCSVGLRHGPSKVMARLARGEAVAASACYFRTVVRLPTGAPQWLHLNKLLALAVGQREASAVKLDFYRLA